jgi:phage gp36-like protein
MAGAGKLFRVTAREAEGFTDYRRAGAAWPRGMGNFRDVLVVEAKDDPPGREVDGQFAIGQETFAIIKADKHLFVTNADDEGRSGEVVELREALEDAKLTFDDLRAENDKLRGRVAELEKGNESLKAPCVELEQLLARRRLRPRHGRRRQDAAGFAGEGPEEVRAMATYCLVKEVGTLGINAAALRGIEPGVISKEIASTSDKMDTYFADRFTLPLTSFDESVRKCCAALTGVALLRTRGMSPEDRDSIKDISDEWTRWLEKVAQGVVRPKVADSSVAAPTNGYRGARVKTASSRGLSVRGTSCPRQPFQGD